ncbi:MAG: hypothetical protein ACYTBX_07865 [Planctomycetota bacterium]|jgi:hypothetical protein
MDFLVKMGLFLGAPVSGPLRSGWLVGVIQVILGSLRNNSRMGVACFLDEPSRKQVMVRR